jgi:hypothetical protein
MVCRLSPPTDHEALLTRDFIAAHLDRHTPDRCVESLFSTIAKDRDGVAYRDAHRGGLWPAAYR